MDPIIIKTERGEWYYYVIPAVIILAIGFSLGEWVATCVIAISYLLISWSYANRDLGKQIVLSKEGITDEKNAFYPWESINHCYIKDDRDRSLTIVFKDEEERNAFIPLAAYSIKNEELERDVYQMAGKNLFRYTYEDKRAEKEGDRTAIKAILKFILIVIGVVLLIALFATLYTQ